MTEQRQANAAAAKIIRAAFLDLARYTAWGNSEQAAMVVADTANALESVGDKMSSRFKKLAPIQPVVRVPIPADLIRMSVASVLLDEVVLEPSVEKVVRSTLDEHQHRDVLEKFQLSPRHRLLLSGPPGCGKTLLAEAIAQELEVPFIALKYGGLVASYMGETGRNLDRVLSYASTAPCVLFFDEFDGIGQSRGGGNDVGEIRRVTNHLLIALEKLPSHVFLVAATNAVDLLDNALLRRFDVHIAMNAPTPDMKSRCALFALRETVTPGMADRAEIAREIAESQDVESLHDICEAAKRARREFALRSCSSEACTGSGLRIAPPIDERQLLLAV